MSTSLDTKKIVLALIGLITLGIFVYYFFIRSSTPVTDLVIPADSQVVGQDILVLVDKLSAISIDSSFLTSPLFSNLKDLETPLIPEIQGRLNPFAVFGADSSSNSTSNSSSNSTSKSKSNSSSNTSIPPPPAPPTFF